MKSLTFSEFFALPHGTIFGQVTGLPDQFSCGLFLKGKDIPEDEEDGRCVAAIQILIDEYFEDSSTEYIYEDCKEPDHRFLVYDSADLDRLAVLIGRGPGWVAQESAAQLRDTGPEREAILDQISRDWTEMAQLLTDGYADRLALSTFRAIARDLKNTDW